jgi:hypothetical protein
MTSNTKPEAQELIQADISTTGNMLTAQTMYDANLAVVRAGDFERSLKAFFVLDVALNS